jgi:hypothetical protein
VATGRGGTAVVIGFIACMLWEVAGWVPFATVAGLVAVELMFRN